MLQPDALILAKFFVGCPTCSAEFVIFSSSFCFPFFWSVHVHVFFWGGYFVGFVMVFLFFLQGVPVFLVFLCYVVSFNKKCFFLFGFSWFSVWFCVFFLILRWVSSSSVSVGFPKWPMDRVCERCFFCGFCGFYLRSMFPAPPKGGLMVLFMY